MSIAQEGHITPFTVPLPSERKVFMLTSGYRRSTMNPAILARNVRSRVGVIRWPCQLSLIHGSVKPLASKKYTYISLDNGQLDSLLIFAAKLHE